MNLLVSGLFSTADSYGKGDAMLEIILMLLVAFILGYLFRYFLSKNGEVQQSDYDEVSHKNSLLSNQLDVQKNEVKRLKAELEKCQKANVLAFKSGAEPAHKDDLKIVEGIGPKIEQLLYAARIYTWDDLSKTEVRVIQTILDKAGPNYKVHNPESWPFQAKLAAENKWDELKKWQNDHKAGRF
jgi:predicted flap endonuclease-1-like 5' DNA nuclease